MSSGFSGGTPNDPTSTGGQPQPGQEHPGQQAYQQPQYTQPLPAGQQFDDTASPWGPPQPNFPPGASAPHYGGPLPPGSQAGPSGPPPQPGVPQQFGAVPYQPPSAPQRKRTGVIVGAIVGVLLLVGGGITVVALNQGGSSGSGGESPTLVEAGGTGTQPSSKQRSSGRTTTTTRSRPTGTPTPVVPGYRVISAADANMVYDVPASWKEVSEDESGGKEAAAADGASYCPGSVFKTIAFLTQTPGTDTNAAATRIGKEAAEEDFQNEKPEGGNPTPFESANGKLKGSFAEFTGPWKPSKAGCTTDRFSVYVFAFRMEGNKCGALVIDADRRTDGELDIEAAKKILSSLRPFS